MIVNKFQHQLNEWRERVEVPLAAASIRRNGSLVWSGLSLDASMRTAPYTVLAPYRFPIYSITKTFTAVCLFRLQSKGLLRLDDPLHK
jgi:CubicO group peptidase (beta-lactamase class C family)